MTVPTTDSPIASSAASSAASTATAPMPALPMRVMLRDGREVVLREICGADKAAVLDAFHHLSAESRHSRFMAAMRELPEDLLESTTHPLPAREFVLVAAGSEDGHEALFGGARFVRQAGHACEFAVTVADSWHGSGLGRQLMQVLLEVARARGYRQMMGYVLASNTSMRALAHRLGFADEACPQDPTLRIVTCPLAEPASGAAS